MPRSPQVVLPPEHRTAKPERSAGSSGSPDDRLHALRMSGYGVGMILVLVPILEGAVRSFPYRVTEVTWRFTAGGLLSNAALLIIVGFAVLILTAATLNHRRTLRALSVLTFLATLGMLAAIGLFALDGTQLREAVDPQALNAFNVALVKTVAVLGLTFCVGLWLTVGSWKASS